ncbi:hypothetical protein [Alkalilacustris brevis]|uniref:hypothetical protein n=1 Tax=Alkalilacustris brevis TaxID=2026338 RepID=UPI000E0D6001|nr:hypothetical protein [Alkalilacustris brevis]
MPNLKIYVDEKLMPERREAIAESLKAVREAMCDKLEVEPSACQIAVVPVLALPDQPGANVEISMLPRPARTPERLSELGEQLRDLVGGAAGVPVAVRAWTVDAEKYVSVK